MVEGFEAHGFGRARTGEWDFNFADDSAWPAAHDEDAVGEEESFFYGVRY